MAASTNMTDPTLHPAIQTGGPKHDHPGVSPHVLTAINMLNLGILIVDREARITFANRSAKDLLQFHREVSVHVRPPADTLQSTGALDRRLRQAIASRERTAESYVALPTTGDKPLTVLVVPCRGDQPDSEAESDSILFVSDPAAEPDVDLRPIAGLYGFTRAEMRLLMALVRGERVGAYAKQTGVTLNTVKGHLNQLFRKTQTHRQSELVLRVLANPVFRLISTNSTSRIAEEGENA